MVRSGISIVHHARGPPAFVGLPVPALARLPCLGRVDAPQANARAGDVDGVAVDDARGPGDLRCDCGSRDSQGDQGDVLDKVGAPL
jgi:hypothetical protein